MTPVFPTLKNGYKYKSISVGESAWQVIKPYICFKADMMLLM